MQIPAQDSLQINMLEYQILRACLRASNDELHRMIEKLLPRGKLRLVVRNDKPPSDAA